MAYNIFIFILFYSIAVVPCIGMYNKALNHRVNPEGFAQIFWEILHFKAQKVKKNMKN